MALTRPSEIDETSLKGQENSPDSAVSSIVAIDDDPMTLRLLQGLFKSPDYQIQTSTDAVAGLELVDHSTSVVLVDLRMPDISGFDCMRYIRKTYPHVQVIVITGSSETSDAVEAMKGGAFQYVTKPFDPRQLRVYVDKAIDAWVQPVIRACILELLVRKNGPRAMLWVSKVHGKHWQGGRYEHRREEGV